MIFVNGDPISSAYSSSSQLVGTDEATTCVGIAIRNSRNGRTSVVHMDSPKVVDAGLCQILALIDTSDRTSEFDVHLFGGYEDISYKLEAKSGSIAPTSFDRSARCPDNIVRGIRVSKAFEDPSWKGKLLETYDTDADQFVISPCTW